MEKIKRDKRRNGSKCIIPCCNRNYRQCSKGPPVKLFKFPLDKEYIEKWLEICNLKSDIDIKAAHICDRHFERKYIGKKRLKSKAIPSLNLSDNQPIEIHNLFDQEFLKEIQRLSTKYTMDGADTTAVKDFEKRKQHKLNTNLTIFFMNACRTCLNTKRYVKPLFGSKDGEQDFEMLVSIVPKLNKTEKLFHEQLPKRMCIPCLNSMIGVHEFQKMCLENDEHWRKFHCSNKCRGCLKKLNHVQRKKKLEGNYDMLLEIVPQLVKIQPEFHNDLEKFMCSSCLKRLTGAHWFLKQCLESDIQLRQIVQNYQKYKLLYIMQSKQCVNSLSNKNNISSLLDTRNINLIPKNSHNVIINNTSLDVFSPQIKTVPDGYHIQMNVAYDISNTNVIEIKDEPDSCEEEEFISCK